MKNRFIMPLIAITSILVLGLVTIGSYAYFSANVTGNESSSANVITSGSLEFEYMYSYQVFLKDAIPGSSTEKYFLVRNTGTADTEYDIYFSNLINTFVDKNDLVYQFYRITATKEQFESDEIDYDNGYEEVTDEIVVPSVTGEESKLLSQVRINAGDVHIYKLVISFKEDETNQDDNKGAVFSAIVTINEYYNRATYAYIYDEMIPSQFIAMEYNEDTWEYEETTISGTKHSLVIRSTPNGDEAECQLIKPEEYDCQSTTIKNGKRLVKVYNLNNLTPDDCDGLNESCSPKEYNAYHNFITSVDIQDTIIPVDTSGWFRDLYNVKSLDISNINTSNVNNMISMFENMYSLENLNLGDFNTDSLIYPASLFSNVRSLQQLDVSSMNTSNVISMKSMFSGMESLQSLDLSNFDTSNVESMEYMFYGDKNLQSLNITSFNVLKTYGSSGDISGGMTSMFEDCESLTELDLSSFDTSNVGGMARMFKNMKSIVELDLSGFSNRSLYSISEMFSGDINLETVIVSNKWEPKSVYTNESVFENCNKIVGELGTVYNANNIKARMAKIDCAPDYPGYFTFNGTQSDRVNVCNNAYRY